MTQFLSSLLFRLRKSLSLALATACVLVCAPSNDVRAKDDVAVVDQAARIVQLIEQLGHEKYVLRERAQEELLQIGAPALDALTVALDNDDVEIVMRSRYLLSAIQVKWTTDDDPAHIQAAMRDYSKKSEAQRNQVMEQIAQGNDIAQVNILCRIVRFEKSHILSKKAALLLIDMAGEKRDKKLMPHITKQLVGCERLGAAWVRKFSEHQDDPKQAATQWKQIADSERKLLEKSSRQTSYAVVQEILFRLVNFLKDAQRGDEAEPYLLQIVELQQEDAEGIASLVEWLIEKDAPTSVLTVQERFPRVFADNAMLLYSVAHAQRALGKDNESKESVRRAFESNSGEARGHLVTAFALQQRGWFDWAESEYRTVTKTEGLAQQYGFRATRLLAEMFHDQGREKEAADELKVLVDAIQQEDSVRQLAQLMEGSIGSIRSRMHYFYAMHYGAQGDLPKSEQALDRAVAEDPTDADVLIALYRLKNQSRKRQSETTALIQKAMDQFREEIKQRADEPQPYNQFAWLVGNTLGEADKKLAQEAVECSLKSLEFRPNAAGYLDTLGRCYYAAGDLENAIKYQSEAARLDPHSGLVRGQLRFFEQALAKTEDNK